MTSAPYKLYLPQEELPQAWYNLRADMPVKPAPLLNPQTKQPLSRDEMTPVFVEATVDQELDDNKAYFDIPGPVMDYYRTFRPSPLCRAYALEKELDTPAKIYYKFEGNNTSGSHKLNSAAAVAYYAKQQGLDGLATETGAGQWGTALSMASAFFGLDLRVFMVKLSAEQKPYRRAVMETYGATVTASPSITTEIGRSILAKDPDCKGSLGCAISEAIEYALTQNKTRYALGSMLNSVLLHQSVIGLESRQAMEMLGETPDIVIGCAGGGSNLGGLICAYMRDKLQGKPAPRFIAVEPENCPSLTRGRFAYDYGDTGHMTPLVKMYTLGGDFMPPSDHAGGLRYHGMSPIVSQLYYDGYLDEARAVAQSRVFEAACRFARVETILPAPESAHAICAAIDEAIRCRESGQSKTILFGLTGTGNYDLAAYSSYKAGTMIDNRPSDELIGQGLATLPSMD